MKRPSSTARGLGQEWRRIRLLVLERDGWQCQLRIAGVCTGRATTVDHVLERDAGGTHDPSNLRAACGPCNSHRGARYVNAKRAGRLAARVTHPFFGR